MQGYIDFIAMCNWAAANPKELAAQLLLDRLTEHDDCNISELTARVIELRSVLADAYLELKKDNLTNCNPNSVKEIQQAMNFVLAAGRFAVRPYIALWDFDQIEEMEFRIRMLKERVIPMGQPFEEKTGWKEF